MRSVSQSISLIGFLSFSLLSITGCGEKRIHVATSSGAPGEHLQASLSEDETTSPNGTSGLTGNGVGESSLSGQNSSPEEVRAEAIQPPPALEPLDYAYQPTLPTLPDEPSAAATDAAGGSSSDPSTGSSLNASDPQDSAETDSSQPSMQAASSGSEDSSDASSPFANGQEIATQSHSHPDNDGGAGGSSSAAAASPALGDELANLPGEVEPIPETVQVAKAEPSEILKEQLDKIKEEELASVSAGLEDVFFQFDSWTLTAEAKESLERDLEWLTNVPSSVLVIEGHADQRGTQAYNMILGKKRAMAIRDYLSQLGVDPSRLSVISYGKDKPFCEDATEVCHQLNRRGHLLVQN